MSTKPPTTRPRHFAGWFAAVAVFALSPRAEATEVRIIGSVSAIPIGLSAITLRADEIRNVDFFTSGTLRIEYWFFSTPYNGNPQIGFKTAEATLGQLFPGFSFFNVTQTVLFALPPDGFYCPSFQVTEFTVTGFRPVDLVNFSCRFVGDPPNSLPSAFFTASPTLGDAPLTVSLDATGSSDSDGLIIAYGWASSAGHARSGVTTTMTFTSPGTFDIVLTVTDNDGATGSFSRTITVTDPSPPDVVVINNGLAPPNSANVINSANSYPLQFQA